MKTRLKHILAVRPNKDLSYGKDTYYMVWSPVHHYWIDIAKEWDGLTLTEQKFLLKQEVIKMGLRNDSPQYIAIYLYDYGKVKNKKYKEKITRR